MDVCWKIINFKLFVVFQEVINLIRMLAKE